MHDLLYSKRIKTAQKKSARLDEQKLAPECADPCASQLSKVWMTKRKCKQFPFSHPVGKPTSVDTVIG